MDEPQPVDLDARLKRALDYGNKQITAQTQRQHLKSRIKVMMLHSMDGGLFNVTIELINFIDFLIRRGDSESVLLDSRDNPIRVSDLPRFLADLMTIYHEITNEYYLEYQKLRKKRSVEALVDLAS